MKKIYLLLFVAIVFTGCAKPDPDQKDEAADTEKDELYKKVMDIHDEVMPKMNDLYKMKKAVEKEIAESPDLVEERKQVLENRLKQLNDANESMMQWMREFDPESFGENAEEYTKYLEGELEKVNKVKEDMLKALEENNQ